MSAGAAAGVSAAFGAPVGKKKKQPYQRTVQTCALLVVCFSCESGLAAVEQYGRMPKLRTKKPVRKLPLKCLFTRNGKGGVLSLGSFMVLTDEEKVIRAV